MARTKTAGKGGGGVFLVQHAGGRPVRAFADRAAAEAYRRELEREVRTHTSPVSSPYIEPWSYCSKGKKHFLAVLARLGLEPPKSTRGPYGGTLTDWAGWWDANHDALTPDQRDAIWDALDRLHYYEVAEVPVEG